jgi:hypothetical protein
MSTKLVPLFLASCISGCGAGGAGNGSQVMDKIPVPATHVVTDENLPIPDNMLMTEYKVLFIGNSHVSGLTKPLRMIMEIAAPQKRLEMLTESSGDYLSERLNDGRTIETLKNDTWSHVIFQAQKYSQSGQVDYPTVGAQKWIQLAKSQNAMPILFPEHPQRGNIQEGKMVHDIHVSIAKLQSSCVAPVGLVWDKVINLMPKIRLHQADGNHASDKGNFLTALVFYEAISGLPADLIPFIDNIDIDMATQDLMGQITSEVIAENPPCIY